MRGAFPEAEPLPGGVSNCGDCAFARGRSATRTPARRSARTVDPLDTLLTALHVFCGGQLTPPERRRPRWRTKHLSLGFVDRLDQRCRLDARTHRGLKAPQSAFCIRELLLRRRFRSYRTVSVVSELTSAEMGSDLEIPRRA